MKTVTYIEAPNGARYLSNEGKQMDILEEITMADFERKFQEISTYWLEQKFPVFLENGAILLQSEWNGEHYFSDGKEYAPLYNEVEEDDSEIIGFYEI